MVRADVVAFLSGSGELDGKWWGEKNASDKPYWWRRYLRERPATPKQDSVGVDEACVAVMRALAEQFEEMALAAQQEEELTRRDVWRDAASQARARCKHPDWIAAALGQAGGTT